MAHLSAALDRGIGKRIFRKRSGTHMSRSSASPVGIATVVALFASVGREPRLGATSVTVLPDQAPHTPIDLANVLAGMTKPVSCVAVLVGDHLYVGAWSGHGRPGVGRDIAEVVTDLAQSRSVAGRPIERFVVRSALGGDTGTLTLDELCDWLRDFSFPIAEIHISEIENSADVTVTVQPLRHGTMSSRS
jgi:hypothetical protein